MSMDPPMLSLPNTENILMGKRPALARLVFYSPPVFVASCRKRELTANIQMIYEVIELHPSSHGEKKSRSRNKKEKN